MPLHHLTGRDPCLRLGSWGSSRSWSGRSESLRSWFHNSGKAELSHSLCTSRSSVHPHVLRSTGSQILYDPCIQATGQIPAESAD